MKKLIKCLVGAASMTAAASLFTAASAQEPIKIGAVLSVTGPASFLGDPQKRTIEMLVEQINASGGINGRKIQLFLYDDGGDANAARTFATRLIDQDKVVAMVGGSTTGTTMSVLPVFEEAEVPFMSMAGALQVVKPVKKWVFKTPAHGHHGVRENLHRSRQPQASEYRAGLRHRRLRQIDARSVRRRRAEIQHQDCARGKLRPA
jgi:hypothetical protein